MADIEVDVAAVRRLESAAKAVSTRLGGMESRVVAAGNLPDSTFGRLPVISDLLRDKYDEQVDGAMELFKAGRDAFDRVGVALADTATAYEQNEEHTQQGFKAMEGGLGR